MSSFIVSKAAYMRAAGLIAGIQDYKRNRLLVSFMPYLHTEPRDGWSDLEFC